MAIWVGSQSQRGLGMRQAWVLGWGGNDRQSGGSVLEELGPGQGVLFCFLLIKEDITLFSFVIPEMTWTPTVAPRSACQVWRGSRAQ